MGLHEIITELSRVPPRSIASWAFPLPVVVLPRSRILALVKTQTKEHPWQSSLAG
jgi:hypothetical protein